MKKFDSEMYQSLLELPLLKGLGGARLHEIIGHTKLHFLKFEPGAEVATPGEPCEQLRFLISGKVRVQTSAQNGDLTLEQTVTAPRVLAPEFLFGRSTAYPGRVVALETVGAMQIAKADYRRLLMSETTMMYNYLNYTCTRAQAASGGLLTLAEIQPHDRLTAWLRLMTAPGATDITLTSASRPLHSVLGMTAANWRYAIARLTESGHLLSASDKEISLKSL